MKKTIVIGIGGTGLATIRELRRLIAERYELGLRAPQAAALKFIYIDTYEGDLNTLNWSVLGKDIRLTEGEKVIITGDLLQPMIESPNDYPDIAPWLPPIKNYVGPPGPGAKGIRPYGRLIYEYNDNKREVRKKIVDCYNSLNQSFTQIQDWRFYLVCGLSGGTGSGMLIPLSFDLQRWDLYQKGTASKKFYSFLVLPPLQIVDRHNRYHANAYAVLSELNYLTFQPDQLPYDNCYLLEPQNANGLEIGLDNLPLLIAQRIFLNIQGGAAASYIDAIMDNPQLGDVEDDPETGRRHSLSFSTFGLSTVSYPREIVAQCLAYHLGEKVVTSWFEERSYKQNINQQVRDDLKSIRLSRSHVNGDGDPFGNNDYPDYAVQINNIVDENLQGITKKQLGVNVDKIRRRIEVGFREVGITEFYNQREKDVSGAVTESLRQIRLKITNFLQSPQLGLGYSQKFLEELINILTEFKSDVSVRSSEKNAKRVRTFQENLSDTVSLVRSNEQKLIYTNSAFQKDYANISDELKQYLNSLASYHSSKYGLAFLDGILPNIIKLRDELDVWESRVREVQQKLAGQLKIILEDIEKGTKENGKAIFSEASLRKLIEANNASVIQNSIEDILRNKLGQDDLDLISLTKITTKEPECLIYESAYQWVLSENCPVDVKRLTLYDKFVREYANPIDRQRIVYGARILSAPFLKFAPSEVGKKQILSTEAAVTTIPDGTGLMSDEGRPAQTLVQSDLEAIGVPFDKIKVAEDGERIIFLQEKQVFPLRFIESLSRLKENYDKFPEKAALHIDKTIEPYLYELYSLSTDEKRILLETEEVFIIARAYDWITCKTNQYTRKEEIRYEFEQVGKMGVQKIILGVNWETAFEAFLKDSILSSPKNEQVRGARERLTAEVQQLRKKAKLNNVMVDDIHAKLEQYLQSCLNEYEAGIDDPRYEKTQQVINRIVNSLQ